MRVSLHMMDIPDYDFPTFNRTLRQFRHEYLPN